MVRRGYDVTVATNARRVEPGYKGPAGVRWKPLPVWSGSRMQFAWDLTRMLLGGLMQSPVRVRRILAMPARPRMNRLTTAHMFLPFAAEQPDLLHFEWNMAAVWYLPLVDLFRCPMIVSCRGSQVAIAPHNPERAIETSLLPATFEKASIIHCVSRAIQREVESMGADPRKIRIITPAVDPEVFRPASAPRTGAGFRIAMIGSVIWSKGYDYAMEALRILRDRGVDASITIIGSMDKSNRQRLLFAIDDLRLSGHVRIAGTLPPPKVVAELQQSDALLLSSLSEGISNAVLEAMSCGLPVVTTACPGMEEAVTDGVDGFLVPLRDPEAIAGVLGRLAAEPELRARMGQAARRRILQDFQLSQQIDKWVSLYEEVSQ